MIYPPTCPAIFLSRPNRFVAICQIGQRTVRAHVRNTGRLGELLLPGAEVWLLPAAPGRKTAYTLIAVQKGERLVNIDSQAPNRVVYEALEGGLELTGLGRLSGLRREIRVGNSRFDIGFDGPGGQPGYKEVKGVTLEQEGLALFPDAPTQRGLRHLQELTELAAKGHPTAVFFLVQMEDVRSFSPNARTHPAFAEALRAAKEGGVHLYCYRSHVTPRSITLAQPVPIAL